MTVIESDLTVLSNNFVVEIDETLTIQKKLFFTWINFKSEILLSPEEHIGFQWCSMEEVEQLLYWDSNKTTWELIKNELHLQ